MIEVKVEEQKCKQETAWGVIEKSLNQHIVSVKNEKGDFVHCGYVGTKSFLPLSGFPAELVEDVCKACEEKLGRELDRIAPPPSLSQIAEMMKR